MDLQMFKKISSVAKSIFYVLNVPCKLCLNFEDKLQWEMHCTTI